MCTTKCASAAAQPEAAAVPARLTHLGLSENLIGEDGARALADALRHDLLVQPEGGARARARQKGSHK